MHSVDDIFNVVATGRVGVGTTTPSYKLHVEGEVYFSANLRNGAGPAHGNASSPGITTTGNTGSGIYWNSNGSGGWGGGSFTTNNSDINMKTSIATMDIDATTIIEGLTPIYFKWTEIANKEDTTTRHASISAQEVKAVFPEAVYGTEWDDDDEDINGYSFDEQALIALAFKSIKELSAKVTALQNANTLLLE
jgi:hypothetical protein